MMLPTAYPSAACRHILAALRSSGCAMNLAPSGRGGAAEDPDADAGDADQHRLAHRSHPAQSERRASLQHARHRARPRGPQSGRAHRFRQGDRARRELHAGLCQPRTGAPPDQQARPSRSPTTTRRSRSIRAMRRPISGAGRSIAQQGRALDALNDYNRAIQLPTGQRAGLLQSRPALSGAGPARVRGRRLHHRDRPRSRDRPSRTPRAASASSRSATAKAAAADLDDAVQAEPESLNAWTSRGLAYERLGDKEKAAGSYAALNSARSTTRRKKALRASAARPADLSDVLTPAPLIPA